jgi:hypothetical protein
MKMAVGEREQRLGERIAGEQRAQRPTIIRTGVLSKP